MNKTEMWGKIAEIGAAFSEWRKRDSYQETVSAGFSAGWWYGAHSEHVRNRFWFTDCPMCDGPSK